MVGTLLLMLPFALAGAVSPMVLTEQTVVLASSGGRRTALRYAAGAVLMLFIYVVVLTAFGRLISLPTHLTFSARLEIGLGVVLILLAVFFRHRGKVKAVRRDSAKTKPKVTSGQAFGLGVVGMATNVTTIAMMVPATKIISGAGLGLLEDLILALILVAIASIPAWLPVTLVMIAPGPAQRFLNALGNFLGKYGRRLVVVLFAGLGLYLVIKGLVALPGL